MMKVVDLTILATACTALVASCVVTTKPGAVTTKTTTTASGTIGTSAPKPRDPGKDGGIVRDWRSNQIGSAGKFAIEPSIGPAGTVVNIYGMFRPAVRGGAVTCSFAGAQPANPYFVSIRRIVVRVPESAKSGAVSCSIQGKTLWNGRFVVTQKLDDIFVPTDEQQGVLGAVYRIPQGTSRLPDFRTLGDPIGTFVVPTVHVSPRNFDRGFPGVDAGQPIKEWYAIRYVGLIDVTREMEYTFKLKNSDGARLYIDDKLVVDNDGVHPTTEKEGRIQLTQGKHRFVVEYFKGSGAQIALEVWWKRGVNDFSGVAKKSLSRYAVEYDCSAKPLAIMCCKAMTTSCRMCAERQRAAMDAWKLQCTR